MKWMRLLWVLSAAALLNAAANDFDGTWKAVFTGPMDERPRTVAEMVFNLKIDGSKVTGMAHMGAWPGVAEISDGRIEGDRIIFSVVGKSPWTGSNGGGYHGGGHPKLVFSGTRMGDSIDRKL